MAFKLPQGMSLHSIGYAALKYPDLPEELPVPLMNQLGALQHSPVIPIQARAMAQIASQYLPTLLEYLSSDAPIINDQSSSQYYCGAAFALTNWMTSNSDVAIRVAKEQKLFSATVDKLLLPDIEEKMKACSRNSSETSFESDFGGMMQFLSTLLLYPEHLPTPPHPRLSELVPKLRGWKRKYKGGFVGRVAERLADQIESPDPVSSMMVRETQVSQLMCGYTGCSGSKDMELCGACKLQRYCCTEHQKKDWKYHKHICNKGLVEPTG